MKKRETIYLKTHNIATMSIQYTYLQEPSMQGYTPYPSHEK